MVEAAFAEGQISRPDYDLRVDRLLHVTTVDARCDGTVVRTYVS